MKRDERSYYKEIRENISIQLLSNFKAAGRTDIKIFWKDGELKKGLNELINAHPKECSCMESYSRRIPPLNVDIFGAITNGIRFELIILEIKLLSAVGLSEWSQLVGYTLVARAKYGLLINIDNGASSHLNTILHSDHDLSQIVTLQDKKEVIHKLGFMQWNSITQNFEYSNIGCIGSLSKLSSIIIEDFRAEP